MAVMKDYDADSFELMFEEDTTADERSYYVKTYPNVNMVADKKVHCTVCQCHLGTAPAAENQIRMHPILRVTHCRKCHQFYNSGEFEKGEDGSELYCRWCGQGGQVYCCSSCPYVFCKKCILVNLARSVVNDITRNDNWSCFSCSPKVMWPLRSQHWALVNFIEKQKIKINSSNLSDNDEIVDAMNKDSSICCKNKRQRVSEVKKKSYKESGTSESESDGNNSDSHSSKRKAKKMKLPFRPPPVKPAPSVGSLSAKLVEMAARMTQAPKNNQAANNGIANKDDIVCTPDLFNFLNESLQTTMRQTPSTSTATPPPSGPPPLLIRNLQAPPNRAAQPVRARPPPQRKVTSVPPRNPNAPLNQVITSAANAASPIYHQINGYRIDLNAASLQTTYQLPNGKIIQVKKQPPVNTNAPAHPPIRQVANTQIRALNSARTRGGRQMGRMVASAGQPRFTAPNPRLPIHGQMISYTNQQVGPRPGHQQFIIQQVPTLQAGQQAPAPHPVPGPGTGPQPRPVVNGLPAMPQMRKYPETPVGVSQRQLERQIFGGQEICHHIVSKLNTLMNSNAYKTVRSMNDIKELHIHLSYLLTYTIGRFKTLQEKCMEDMRKMGFNSDADSLVSGQVIDKYGSDCEEDDLEIVEPQHATIAIIDSDDDEQSATDKNKSLLKPTLTGFEVGKVSVTKIEQSEKEKPKAAVLQEDQSLKCAENEMESEDIDMSALLEPQVILADGEESEHIDENEIPMPPPLTPPPNIKIDLQMDDKLNSPPVVVLKRCDKQLPVIKNIIANFNADDLVQKNDEANVPNGSSHEVAIVVSEKNIVEQKTLQGLANKEETSEKIIAEEKTCKDESPAEETSEKEGSETQTVEENITKSASTETTVSDSDKTSEGITLDDSLPLAAEEKNTEDSNPDQSEPMETDDVEIHEKTPEEVIEKSEDIEDTIEKMPEVLKATKEIPSEVTENLEEGITKDIPMEVPEDVLSTEVQMEETTTNDSDSDKKDEEEKPVEEEASSSEVTIDAHEAILPEPITIEPSTEEVPKDEASSAGNTNGTISSSAEESQSAELENISSPDTFEDYSKNGIDANKVTADEKTLPADDAFAEAIDDLLMNSDQFPDMDDVNQIN